jgi:ATP-dependent DNA helicase RecQ
LDLPDIKIVVQYRVPGDLSALWQRWGRAVRTIGEDGIGLLLVEKGYYDEERVKKEMAAVKKRKRKAAGKGQRGRPQKRQRLDACVGAGAGETVDGEGSDDDEGEVTAAGNAAPSGASEKPPTTLVEQLDTDEQRRAVYHNATTDGPLSVILAKSKRLNAQAVPNAGRAMDDLINATNRGLTCRRHVINIYFGNDRACTLPTLNWFSLLIIIK